jgi:hypothetical protein
MLFQLALLARGCPGPADPGLPSALSTFLLARSPKSGEASLTTTPPPQQRPCSPWLLLAPQLPQPALRQDQSIRPQRLLGQGAQQPLHRLSFPRLRLVPLPPSAATAQHSRSGSLPGVSSLTTHEQMSLLLILLLDLLSFLALSPSSPCSAFSDRYSPWLTFLEACPHQRDAWSLEALPSSPSPPDRGVLDLLPPLPPLPSGGQLLPAAAERRLL